MTVFPDPPHTDSGEITYSPAAGYNGSDSFTYKTNDGTTDSNTATVSITVGNPNSDMYVWDIEFESRIRGNGAKHGERIVVTVRRDSDNNGVGEISD